MTEVTAKAARTNKKVGRTASKEVRRQQLIDATIESIAKYGIAGTTMTTVTGYAGLSLGIVNFHFQNKENLFAETLRHLAEEHRETWRKRVQSPDMTPAAKLLAIADAHFHPSICNRKNLSVWFGFYGETGYRAAYREMVSEIDTERWETSIEMLEQIIDEGGYEGLDAEQIATMLEGLYDGFWLNILIYPGDFSREEAKQRLRQYLAQTLPDHFDTPAEDATPCKQERALHAS